MSATGRSYTHDFFESSVCYYSSKPWSKIAEKNLQLPMKKYSLSIRLLTVKNSGNADLRTSHAQLSKKACQPKEDDSENKILS